MLIPNTHGQDDPNPRCTGRVAPSTEVAGGARGYVALRLPPQRVREVAGRPTMEEMRARLQQRSRVTLSISPADAIRAERDSR